MSFSSSLRAVRECSAAAVRAAVRRPLQLAPAAALGVLSFAVDPFDLLKLGPTAGPVAGTLFYGGTIAAAHAAYAALAGPGGPRFAGALPLFLIVPVADVALWLVLRGAGAGIVLTFLRPLAAVVVARGLPALRDGGGLGSALALAMRRARQEPVLVVILTAAVVAFSHAFGALLDVAIRVAAPNGGFESYAVYVWTREFGAELFFDFVVIGSAFRVARPAAAA